MKRKAFYPYIASVAGRRETLELPSFTPIAAFAGRRREEIIPAHSVRIVSAITARLPQSQEQVLQPLC